MTKIIIACLAIIAVSASPALAAKKGKPKAPAPAAATSTTGPGPFMGGQVSAADRALYEKNQRESGMKKK
jgi:hypothetical protein